MEMLLEETSTLVVAESPLFASHDSADEHSLDHWLRVYWMVEEENLLTEELLTATLI